MVLEPLVPQCNEASTGIEGLALSLENLQDTRSVADIETFDKVTFGQLFSQSGVFHFDEKVLLLFLE